MSLTDSTSAGDSMAGMTSHARTSTARTPGLWAAWAVLIAMGGTSVTYNVYHAVQHGSLNLILALLYGIAPVLAAALLSHIVAEYDGGRVMQGITFVVMLGAMAMSIGATASVVQPAAGRWMQWLFGAVTDAAALVALRVILVSRSRKAQAAAEAEAGRTVVQEATAKAVQIERELATVKAELGAELATVKTELEAARAALLRGGPRKRSSAPRKTARTAPVDDVALEAKALELLATDLDMSGADLARKLGVSPSYGRKLRRKLTAPDRPLDRSGPLAQERQQERSQER